MENDVFARFTRAGIKGPYLPFIAQDVGVGVVMKMMKMMMMKVIMMMMMVIIIITSFSSWHIKRPFIGTKECTGGMRVSSSMRSTCSTVCECGQLMEEADRYEDRRERAFRYIILFAVLISTIAISSLTVTLPISFTYVTSLDRRISSEIDYCRVCCLIHLFLSSLVTICWIFQFF